MMKIHTTQDLNSLVQQNQQTTNNVSSRDFRLKNYSEQMSMPRLSANADYYSTAISFGKKKVSARDAKKIIDTTAKLVGDIKKDGQPVKKRGDKVVTHPLFEKALSLAKYETAVQAIIAAAICTILRPATIMAIPTKKSKQDNMYASAHSMASGIVGLFSTLILTVPFKWGADHVMNKENGMFKNLSKEALERWFPNLDTKTIEDAKGIRKAVSEWKDKAGNKFSTEFKDCEKIASLTQLADASVKTFENVLGVKVNWAAQKDKSFNDVVCENGKKFYDELNWNKIGIVVKQDGGMGEARVLLRDLDSKFLGDIIRDAESNSNWKKLDINSVYDGKLGDKNSIVKDFRQWKDVNGKQWIFELDKAFVSSPYETAKYTPRISGAVQYIEKEGVDKYVTYQKNGVGGKLGTPIDKEMVKAEEQNEGHKKLLTWLPDLVFRIPIAVSTIALIPWILKNVFHVEKSKKKEEIPAENQPAKVVDMQKINESTAASTADKPAAVAFKGKGGDAPKKANIIARVLAKLYGKGLVESPTLRKISEKLSKIPGGMTQLMTVAGSFITSSVYVHQTLTNKDLDPEKRRTLSINQALCFVIPTAAAYYVDSKIKDWTKKNMEYRYSGWKEREIEIAELEKKAIDVKGVEKELGDKLKGVRLLASIATFTLIYRYATPVIITPIANWIGRVVNGKKNENAQNDKPVAKEIAINPSNNQTNASIVKEIELNPINKEVRKSA